MAKKIRNKVEQALYDLQTARKMIKKAAEDLESSVDSRDNRIFHLEKEVESDQEWVARTKDDYEAQFLEIFGVNVDTYLEGFRFERHVVWWMNRYYNQYTLKIWQGDKCYKPYDDQKLIRASWNSYPDLIYVDENKKAVLTLECKYRANGIIKLDKAQFENYKNFEKQIADFMNVKVKVYVMVGTSGSSDRPDFMYCVPLNCLRNEREMDLKSYPQYLIMERNDNGQDIQIYKDDIPF